MTPIITLGDPDAFEPKPLKGFPPGKARLRIREDAEPIVFVRTITGVRAWHPMTHGPFWVPCVEIGENRTVENSN